MTNIEEMKAYSSEDEKGKVRFSMKKFTDAVYLVRKVILDTIPTKYMLELLNGKSFNDTSPNNLDYGICYYLLQDATLSIVPERSEIPKILPCLETLELQSMGEDIFAWCKDITYRIVKENIDKIEINLDICEEEYKRREKDVKETIALLNSLGYKPRVCDRASCKDGKSIRFFV